MTDSQKITVMTGAVDVLALISTAAQPLVDALEDHLKEATAHEKDPEKQGEIVNGIDQKDFITKWMQDSPVDAAEIMALAAAFSSSRTLIQRPAAQCVAAS